MRQIVSSQDPVDGSLGRQRYHIQIFHLPENGLSTTEEILVVQVEAYHLDDFFNLS
jgi:hypothetical protein